MENIDTSNLNVEENEENQHSDDYKKLEEEYKKLEEDYLRMHADFENIKVRMKKEQKNAILNANEKFALDILEILDTLYISLTMIKNDSDKEGINNTIDKFQSILEKHNITEVTYENFEPNIHMAVQTVEAKEHESGSIVDIMTRGYLINDKLLRNAIVTIAN